MRRSEENFRRSLDESPLGVRIVTREGDTLFANKAILDFYGFDGLEEFRQTPIEKRYTSASYRDFKDRQRQRENGVFPTSYEISILRKDGETRILQVLRKDVLWNGKKQNQTLYLDITKRKRAEERLQETLQRLRQAITSTISVLSHAVEARDPYTAGHQRGRPSWPKRSPPSSVCRPRRSNVSIWPDSSMTSARSPSRRRS